MYLAFKKTQFWVKSDVGSFINKIYKKSNPVNFRNNRISRRRGRGGAGKNKKSNLANF